METVFFSVPVSKLEPVVKKWFNEVLTDLISKNTEPTERPEQLLTVQEAAQLLNLTVPTMYSKVSKRELPVMKRGKRLYFSSTELMEYIKKGRKKSNAEIEQEAEKYLSNNKKGLKL